MKQNIFSFFGKLTRTAFWLTFLIYVLIVIAFLCGVFFSGINVKSNTFIISHVIFILFMKYLLYAAGAKRITDAGYPWYLIFLGLIPVFGNIAVIILFCLPSSDIVLSK
ncbi:DUF805 domain-containing protein [Companilactobacillus sp. RD055328]|uniref:DUF805 domain-containing protein n=1 Tax=Companilactobacillus sp. RD055328 TaxID=2916634 RepID=UPI001FC82B58|nr:DUF805 domain-containing protein [Companilactobacillus sp. RD055328]